MVRFENVGMRYGLGPEVLRDVTLDIAPGSFHFLTGPSGAGKSSFLKILYLAHRPSRGLINLFGTDVTTARRNALPALRRRIGVVFQDYRLVDHLTVYDNVALPLAISGTSEVDYANNVRELLSWVGLGDRLLAKPRMLSGGEQQRVAIARAVVGRPDLLVADEPTGNVDPDMAMRLLRLFVELNRAGTSIVLATHDRGLVDSVDATELRLRSGELTVHRPRNRATS